MSSALTEAEVEFSDFVRSIRFLERQIVTLEYERDVAQARLDQGNVDYANAVVALIQARAALNAPRQSVATADPPTTGSVPE